MVIGYELFHYQKFMVFMSIFFLNPAPPRLWSCCGCDLSFIDHPLIALGSYSWLSFFSWILPFLCCDLVFSSFTPIKFPLRVTICYVLSLWPCYNIFFGLHYCSCLCFGLLLNLCCKLQVHTYVTQGVSSKTCLKTMVESIHCILDYKPNKIAFFSSLSFLFFSFLFFYVLKFLPLLPCLWLFVAQNMQVFIRHYNMWVVLMC